MKGNGEKSVKNREGRRTKDEQAGRHDAKNEACVRVPANESGVYQRKDKIIVPVRQGPTVTCCHNGQKRAARSAGMKNEEDKRGA